jgi:5-methylcytosine-specific restriction endonuclease McrA
MVTTRQLAGKVVQLYWPHTIPFAVRSPAAVLRQSATGQAEVVSTIRQFREMHAPDPTAPHWQSRITAPSPYERLVRDIEWKLIEMPLPRLQTMGREQREFIYRIHWNTRILRRAVAAYQRGEPDSFDNAVLLLPDVGEYFVQLSGLLRPLIQRRWAAMIAQVNRLEESQLETFLFGATRTPTANVRAGLWEIQGRRCFYCAKRVAEPAQGEVDHFVPWSRYPDDGLDNFVVADRSCNGKKSSSLAADAHLARWTRRFAVDSGEFSQLRDLAASTSWDRRPNRSLSVARAIYPRLPSDARLWLRDGEFIPPDMEAIVAALEIRSAPVDA